MKHYLSFGGGVNSVALHLLMLKEGYEFESVFVNHGADYPETYKYLEMFQCWLKTNSHKPVTVLKPNVRTKDGKIFHKLYDYYFYKKLTPSRKYRSCSNQMKVSVVHKYVEKPCFMHIGIDAGESHRAKIAVTNGVENRWLLIENEIDREGCKRLIKEVGLPVPPKSGCFCCPFQGREQFKRLRKEHPELFCKVEQIENAAVNSGRKNLNPKWVYLRQMPIRDYINEKQRAIFETDEYPPCQCGL